MIHHSAHFDLKIKHGKTKRPKKGKTSDFRKVFSGQVQTRTAAAAANCLQCSMEYTKGSMEYTKLRASRKTTPSEADQPTYVNQSLPTPHAYRGEGAPSKWRRFHGVLLRPLGQAAASSSTRTTGNLSRVRHKNHAPGLGRASNPA